MNIRVNPSLFIDRYFKGAKITQTTREYRIGNKGSKCILKDGSGYFDHEEGNYTSIFNEIKNRESFRPFACSVLEEQAGEYFEMENIKNTPFMMHAPTVKEKAKKEIPALVHDDDTCRIQTVNQNDNKVLHEILTKFKKPIIMNTSFNLAGRPIVETIRDALYTARQSKLKYVYFADVNKLFIKCH